MTGRTAAAPPAPRGRIEIVPVEGAARKREFLDFPYRLYAGDALWVPPPRGERRRTVDPRRGEFFLHGEAAFFLARLDGRTVGTICAAEDTAANAANGARDALFGFFEYFDLPGAASALVDAAARWAAARGLDALFGPVNLDYENAYGVLVEGRDRPPTILCGHGRPYYPATMDALGFAPARDDNIAFELRLDRPLPDRARLAAAARIARERSGIRVRSADFSRFDDEVDKVHGIINRALAHLKGFLPYPRSAVESLVRPFKDFADPDLILFAEREGETLGFLPAVPNLNEALIGLNGLRGPLDWLKLPFAIRRRYECVSVKSVLVPPERWGTGTALALFDELYRRLEGKGYSWLDLSLTSEENPNTVPLATRFGARIYKRYRVYRKSLALDRPRP